MKKSILFFALTIFITSCIPEEDPISPIDRGDLITTELTNSMYEFTSYFDLSSASFIANYNMFNWDLAYDCRADSHFVFINSGKSIKGVAIPNKKFEEIVSEDQPDSLFVDEPCGYGDKSIFGSWWQDSSTSFPYFLNGGINERRRPNGNYKIKLELLHNSDLKITYQKFGEDKKEKILQKNDSYNFVYMSFKDDIDPINEPLKDDYDLVFTSNTEYVPFDNNFPDENTQYQVRGVYLNPNKVAAKLFENAELLDFSEIDYNVASVIELSDAKNAIGYDWKAFTINSDIYSVDNSKYYIVKSTEGLIYKMRFIRFYDDEGRRGYPEFEFKQL